MLCGRAPRGIIRKDDSPRCIDRQSCTLALHDHAHTISGRAPYASRLARYRLPDRRAAMPALRLGHAVQPPAIEEQKLGARSLPGVQSCRRVYAGAAGTVTSHARSQ